MTIIPTVKTCSKCNVSKPASEFWKLKRGSDGLQPQCKECKIAYRNSPKVRERTRNYHKEYRKTHPLTEKQLAGRRDYMRAYMRKYNLSGKAAAANAVRQLIQSGKIPHPNFAICTDCGDQAEHYHHPDYDKPEFVVALCAECHGRTRRID